MEKWVKRTKFKRIFLIFIIGILLFVMIIETGLVDARLPNVKSGDCVAIKTILNSSYVNISSISYPNSSIVITNQPMTKNGYTFNYSFCHTEVFGIYVYDYNDEIGNVYANDFKVNYDGKEDISQEQVNIYIIALIFLIILSLGIFFIINKLPSGDTANEEGMIIQINMLKHLRPVLYIFIWVIGIGCIFIISNLGIAYLNDKMIGDLFFVIYRILFYVTIIGVPVYFIWIFYKIFKDRQMKEMMERGIEFQGKVI